jgi:hypothetical protein
MDEGSRKKLVDTWMKDDLIKRHFNLECPSDEETPVEPITEKETPPPKKVEKKKAPAKKKSSSSKKFDAVKFLKENPDTPIKFIQNNPKRPGSGSYDTYEGYKTTTTFQEFLDAGGKNGDMRWDFGKGFLEIQDDRVPNVEYVEKKKTTPKKKKSPAKKEKNKKKVEEKVEKVEENVEKVEEKVDEKEEEAVVEKVEEKIENIDLWGDKDESDEEAITFKPLSEVTTDEEDIEDNDDEWPSKTIDGVEYIYNDSDRLLIDKETAEQVGYLDDDGTIDYIGNGEDIHEKNKENL